MSTVIPIPVIKSTILTAATVGIIALLVKISCYCSDCCQECFKGFYYVFQVNLNWIFLRSTSLHFWSKDLKKNFPFMRQTWSPGQDFLPYYCYVPLQHKYYTKHFYWSVSCAYDVFYIITCLYPLRSFSVHENNLKPVSASEILRTRTPNTLRIHHRKFIHCSSISYQQPSTSFLSWDKGANTTKRWRRLSNHFYFSVNG